MLDIEFLVENVFPFKLISVPSCSLVASMVCEKRSAASPAEAPLCMWDCFSAAAFIFIVIGFR